MSSDSSEEDGSYDDNDMSGEVRGNDSDEEDSDCKSGSNNQSEGSDDENGSENDSEDENGSKNDSDEEDFDNRNGSNDQSEHEEMNIEDFEDAESSSEAFEDSESSSEDLDNEDENVNRPTHAMSIAIAVAQGTEISSEDYQWIQKTAEESTDDLEKLHCKYILCAQAAEHGGFIEPDYFGNLPELLTTNNVIIRQCIMWAFASILPCKNVLSPLLIRLLCKSLKDETLGWSISYLFRKMSEYEKYTEMITCASWISMSKLLFDLTLSEQVRMTIVFTLNNVYKIRKWTSPVIKQRFEELLQIDGIGTRVLIATVQSLQSMVLSGANLEKETVSKLRYLSNNGDSASLESIQELLDFLDNRRILSHASGYSGSNVKKELVATQNTSVSRSEEESVEPTVKLHSMDHLLNTVGHLGRTFNAESIPIDVCEGHNQAWYRTTWAEVTNLAALAKQGNLKDQDFDYLMKNFRDGPHWGAMIFNTKIAIFEIVAGVFRDAAEVKQAIPGNILDVMIGRLSGTNEKIHRQCAEGLLFVLKNQQSFTEEQMEHIETALKNTNDSIVKQHLIELYALYIIKGHHFKLDLNTISDGLLNKDTCESTSYIFFKAAALEKRSFSNDIMKKLGEVASSKEYDDKARDNCLWAMAYSIKETNDKTTISAHVIDTLGVLLTDTEPSVKKTAAIAICYYANDPNTGISTKILEGLAELLKETDYDLLSNILSVYLRLSKQEKEIPHTAVEKLTPLLYREEYEIRENAIWTLKYIVDNKQEVKLKIIDQIDGCLNDSQFGIRNPAAMVFVNYWTKQMKDNHENFIGLLSARTEKFLSIIFRQVFSLNVQQSSLDLLQIMITKDFVLSETLFHLLECCLYDQEQTISKKSIGILRHYSRKYDLPSTTFICLEHLLTTETPILNEVILILKSVVSNNGYRLSRKAIDILAQLLFKSSEPKEIIILLTHADRNQPLPKSIDELLKQMYYCQILKHSTCSTSLNKATEGLLRSTSEGKLLSNFVLNLIIDQLKLIERRTSLIPILVKAVFNGQTLNKDHHRLTLETIFFEMFDQPSVGLMEIFTHLTRQNQIITDRIIEKLEYYLYEPLTNHFVIEIYQHLIERQKPLSPDLIKTIFEFFHPQQWNNLNDRFKHQLILFYKAIADNRPKEANQNYLPFLLNNHQSIYFRKEICISIRLLVEHHEKLHSKTIDCLINLIHDDNDADLQQIALEILNYIRSTNKDANQDLSKFLDLFQLNEQTDDRTLLQHLKDAMSTIDTLPDNLSIRLSHMLYSCDLQVKKNAALILAKTIPKGKILPQQVLQVIFWTLMDNTINRETLPILLNQNFEKSLPSSTIDDLIYLANHSSDQSIQKYAKEILHQQIKSNPIKIELFFEYLQSTNNIKNEKNFRQTIKFIRAMIIIDKQLSIEKLSFLNDHFFDEEQNEIIDILFLAHRYNISFHQHQKLVKSVEIALQTHPTRKLFELLEIFIENRVILQEKTLATLFDQIVEDEKHHALIVLENVSGYQIIPEKMLMYFIDLISNRSNEMFIAPSFSIIRQQISQGFIIDSMNILERIQFPSIIDITQLEKLDLIQERLRTIETLLFITYFHIDIFQQPIHQWSRNCLCFEIISTCSEVTNDQIIHFYQNLTQLELWKNYDIFDERRDIFLRHLINKQRTQSLSLSTINDILIYAKTSTDRPLTILKSNEIDWLIQMRSCYIEDQLVEQFRPLQYNSSLINHLVQRLTEQEQISAIFISSCLQLMRSANDISTILELFNTYGVTSADMIEVFFQGESPTNFDTLQKKIHLLIVGKTLISHWTGSNKNLSKARILLQRLIEHKWPVSKLLSILTTRAEIKLSADASESLLHLIDVLKILVDYNVDSNISCHLQSILSENEIKCWPSTIYNRVIEHHFGSSSSEKNLDTLLNEIHKFNQHINKEVLLKKYQTIESKYKANSTIISCKEPIKSWSKSTIEDWAKHARRSDSSSESTLFEIIAVMKRAVYLDSNFEPRPIQILAILILLDTTDQRGRILQILTGEGKSTVVSILAAIKALQNQHVDIITSSITLAKRDAQERKSFYDYFNITVAHNNDETSYTSGPKQCYHADVVYGNSSQFQFDLLRHEFSLLNTRTLNKKENLSRHFDAVIIDEVDSMLIDENNTLARLADQLPGMEWLNPLLFGIWRAIDAEVEPESKRDTIIDNIRKLLSDPDSDLKIPTHLTEFVHESIATWVDHAILAKVEYRLDHHYIIKPDETRTKRIMPIDFSNTGVVQPSTTWSDGLHQFLQIKHGLKMTTLTVTTNYLSNIGLFTRYGKNIFGLTGTIGSHDARDLLDRMYHVDTIIIPPFKQKRHIQLQTILTENDDEWLQTIVSETIGNARKQRGILVICETRLDAKTISKQLQRADPTCLVRLYTDNTDAVESNVVGNQIQASEIIVATNLAGRGTDLKTSSIVEQNGGLHVCLTFLPNNLRVEEQAFGRTSRQGQRGTSQMILSRDRTFQQLMINYPEYQNIHKKPFTDPLNLFHDWREQAERIHLERIWRDEIVDIKLKDELFQHFCKLLDQLRQENDNVYRLLSMKEQWGLWLKSMDYITQSRLNLRLFLERQGLKIEDVPQDGHSFFHAIERQLDNKLTNEQIKDQVIELMIGHAEHYSNITDEKRHQATSEALKINLIIYRTDSRSPHIYQREDALHTCHIGYEVGSYYFSIRSDDTDDVTSAAKKTEQQQKSNKQKLFDQFKRVADTTKRFLDQVEEQKQCFNEKLSTKIIDHDLKAGLAKFREKMITEYKKEDFIQNPCYLLMEADTMTNQLSAWTNVTRSCFEVLPWTKKRAFNYKDIIDRLEKAIKLDPVFTFAAQVTLSHFLIDKEKESMKPYKIKAKSYLVRAQEILGRYILPQLHSMQLETKKSNDELIFGDLINQTQLKVEIFQVYQNYLGQAIRTIEDSQKLTDVIIINKDNCNEMTIKKKLYRDEVKTVLDKSTGTISLAFHSLKCHQDLGKHDQALNLLDILSEEHEKVSIRFLDGSKTKIEELKKIISSCNVRLNIEYLDSNEVQPLMKLSNKTIDLKLTATTDDYLKLIQTLNKRVTLANNNCQKKQKKTNKKDRQIAEMDKTMVLITNEQQLSMTTDQALEFLPDNGSSIESILFKSIEIEQVDFIISTVTKPSFTLTYHSLKMEDLTKMIENVHKPFNYEIRNLSKEKAKKLIKKTTDRSFLLIIEDLSIRHARKINEDFKRDEQDVKSNMKRLTEHFTKSELLYEELNAYELLGINLLISIDELDPRSWISATVVVFLGAGQIAGGIWLAAITGGLSISLGISLIGEGLNDIVFGVRGAISRRFSWKDYAIQKGISLAICFASLGFSAVTEAVKGAQAVGVTGVASTIQATRQGTVAIFKNSFRRVGEGAIKGFSSTSWLLACKQVVVTCAETGARELANYFSEAAYQGILCSVKSNIREEIETTARIHLNNKHYQRILHRALAIDLYYGKDEWQNQIEQIAMNILTKNKDQFIETIQSLSKGITNAFLNHSRQLASQSGIVSGSIRTAQLLMTIVPILKGANEIRTLTDSFFAQYKQELQLLEVKIPSIEDLLLHASNEEFSSSTTKDIVQVLTNAKILNTHGFLDARLIQDQDEDETDFSNVASFRQASDELGRTSKDKLLTRLRHIKFQEDQHRCCAEKVLIKMIGAQNHRSLRASIFQKRIVDILTDQVCAIIYGTMVTPMMNYVTSRVIASLSTAIQLKLDPNGTVTEQLMEQGAKRYIHGIANDLVDQYNKGELQFDRNAKQKLDQLEERFEKEGEKPITLNEELALSVKNGKQGGIIELCVMAILTKKPITILQQEMSGEVNNNDGSIKMVYTPPKIDAESGKIIDGHYEAVGGTTAIGDMNDCMYTAILSKTQGQFPSVQEIRTQCAAFILTNPNFICGIHPALSIINQTRSPLRWKELTGEGGAKKVEFKDDDVKTLKGAKEKALEDLKSYVSEQPHVLVSNTAKESIQKLLEDPKELGNFDKLTNGNTGIVQIDYDISVQKSEEKLEEAFKIHLSVNADPPNQKLNQRAHFGTNMWTNIENKRITTHKFFPKWVLQSRRPKKKNDPQPNQEVKEYTLIIPTGETVTYTKTIWQYPPPW